jgi:hypothetical protein
LESAVSVLMRDDLFERPAVADKRESIHPLEDTREALPP